MEKMCDTNDATLFMFSSSGCPPCRVIHPRVEKTCKEVGIELEYIDVQENAEIYIKNVQEGKWPLIRATPTFFILYKDTFAQLRDFTMVTSSTLLCEVIGKIKQELAAPGTSSSSPNINLN